MIRTVQTTVIYCFETRDEKASMSIVVFKHRQRLGIAWAQNKLLRRKTRILFTDSSEYSEHYEQVEKTPNENY